MSDDSDAVHVPIGVLEGIKALEEGRTMSAEDIDRVLKF